uniref:CTCK domain-containing protein n=1 Tax=Panagrellus redivivus TaxID=6233 RepID=A0A7E4ZRB8_PANRE
MDGGVIPLPEFFPTTELTTVPTTTITTTTTTTAAPTCPAPSKKTVQLVTDTAFRQQFSSTIPIYDITFHEESTCTLCKDGVVGYYKAASNVYPESDNAIVSVSTLACRDVCICTETDNTPVTDGTKYLKATSISCVQCIRTECI